VLRGAPDRCSRVQISGFHAPGWAALTHRFSRFGSRFGSKFASGLASFPFTNADQARQPNLLSETNRLESDPQSVRTPSSSPRGFTSHKRSSMSERPFAGAPISAM
jgi:hypothetical protein